MRAARWVCVILGTRWHELRCDFTSERTPRSNRLLRPQFFSIHSHHSPYYYYTKDTGRRSFAAGLARVLNREAVQRKHHNTTPLLLPFPIINPASSSRR